MALLDIINAIKAQADREIAQIQEIATREKNTIRAKSDEELAVFEENLKKETEAKKAQMEKKAHTLVQMERRKIILEEKRNALDAVYAAALKEVQALPEEKQKKVLEALSKHLQDHKGEKHDAKEGGFLFVSDKTEEDFTFPHIIENTLRPETELEVSAKLFA